MTRTPVIIIAPSHEWREDLINSTYWTAPGQLAADRILGLGLYDAFVLTSRELASSFANISTRIRHHARPHPATVIDAVGDSTTAPFSMGRVMAGATPLMVAASIPLELRGEMPGAHFPYESEDAPVTAALCRTYLRSGVGLPAAMVVRRLSVSDDRARYEVTPSADRMVRARLSSQTRNVMENNVMYSVIRVGARSLTVRRNYANAYREALTPRADALTRFQAVGPIIRAAAVAHNIPAGLMYAIAWRESRFNPTAIGVEIPAVRAEGLFQIIGSTRLTMGIRNALDPTENANGAARLLVALRRNWSRRDGQYWEHTLSAYGQGSGSLRGEGLRPHDAENARILWEIAALWDARAV